MATAAPVAPSVQPQLCDVRLACERFLHSQSHRALFSSIATRSRSSPTISTARRPVRARLRLYAVYVAYFPKSFTLTSFTSSIATKNPSSRISNSVARTALSWPDLASRRVLLLPLPRIRPLDRLLLAEETTRMGLETQPKPRLTLYSWPVRLKVNPTLLKQF